MHVPALPLCPDATALRTPLRAARAPERCWPRAILHRPVAVGGGGRHPAVVLLAEPDAVRRVLVTDAVRFPKWLPVYRHSAARETGPESIFAQPPDGWRPLRRAIAPLFAADRFDTLAAISQAATRAALSRGPADLEVLVTAIALDVAWRSLMGDGPNTASPDALDTVAADLVATRRSGDLAAGMRAIERLAATARQRGPGPCAPPGCDLARETPGAPPALRGQARDVNRLALLYSGQETTALTLAWACWLLGQDSALQARLRDEVRRHGPSPDPACLPCLTAVLRETLRLFSPSVATVRMTPEPVDLAGAACPAGSVIVVPIYALHRHAALWNDPGRFDPRRFAGPPQHPMAFLPFAAGPHTCIAARSSLVEMVAVLATLLDLTEWQTFDAAAVGLRTQLVLTPTLPLQVGLAPVRAATFA